MNRNDQNFADLVEGDWVSIADNEWELLTGVLLDTRTKLEDLRASLVRLKAVNLLDYRRMREFAYMYRDVDDHKKTFMPTIVEQVLRQSKYPWAKQKSRFFDQEITFDLKTATFEQMTSILGIGDKLASLWMRIMHPERADDFVVIDTHVRRFIRNLGFPESKMSYEDLSRVVRRQAERRGMSVTEFDELIVGNGIRARRGLPLLPIPEISDVN